MTAIERRLHAVPASNTDEDQADDVDQDQAAVIEQDQADRAPVADAAVAEPVTVTATAAPVAAPAAERTEPVSTVAEPAVTTFIVPPDEDAAPVSRTTSAVSRTAGRWRNVPVYLIALGAFVAIWGGWVGLGELTGFGPVEPAAGHRRTAGRSTPRSRCRWAWRPTPRSRMRVWLDHTSPHGRAGSRCGRRSPRCCWA